MVKARAASEELSRSRVSLLVAASDFDIDFDIVINGSYNPFRRGLSDSWARDSEILP